MCEIYFENYIFCEIYFENLLYSKKKNIKVSVSIGAEIYTLIVNKKALSLDFYCYSFQQNE